MVIPIDNAVRREVENKLCIRIFSCQPKQILLQIFFQIFRLFRGEGNLIGCFFRAIVLGQDRLESGGETPAAVIIKTGGLTALAGVVQDFDGVAGQNVLVQQVLVLYP